MRNREIILQPGQIGNSDCASLYKTSIDISQAKRLFSADVNVAFPSICWSGRCLRVAEHRVFGSSLPKKMPINRQMSKVVNRGQRFECRKMRISDEIDEMQLRIAEKCEYTTIRFSRIKFAHEGS